MGYENLDDEERREQESICREMCIVNTAFLSCLGWVIIVIMTIVGILVQPDEPNPHDPFVPTMKKILPIATVVFLVIQCNGEIRGMTKYGLHTMLRTLMDVWDLVLWTLVCMVIVLLFILI